MARTAHVVPAFSTSQEDSSGRAAIGAVGNLGWIAGTTT